MKIKSSFHDYYDGVMKMDREPEPLYLRKTIQIKRKDTNIAFAYDTGLSYGDGMAIGFCGKIYPVVIMSSHPPGDVKIHYTNCYNVESAIAFIERDNKHNKLSTYSFRNYERFFEINSRMNVDKIFQEYKAPIFTVDKDYLTINASLRKFEFAKIFDPYRAYQEIMMYMSNMANPEKPIPHVSDRDLLEGKGFCKKWSFRKESEKKKR